MAAYRPFGPIRQAVGPGYWQANTPGLLFGGRRSHASCAALPESLAVNHSKLAANIELQPVDEQLIVLDLNHNAYYSLNGTARFFVEKIAQGLDDSEIVQAALVAFDGVDVATLDRDLASLKSELLSLGILQ